jgi:hypothetical protein
MANRRKGVVQGDPALNGQGVPTELAAGDRPTGTTG